VNSISLKEGEEAFIGACARKVRSYGAASGRHGFDEQGQADSMERKALDLQTLLRHPHYPWRSFALKILSRSQHLRRSDGYRRAQPVWAGLH